MLKAIGKGLLLIALAFVMASAASHYYFSQHDAELRQHTQRVPGPAQLTREQMQADIAWFRDFYARVHPPVAKTFPIRDLRTQLSELAANLPATLSAREFYVRLAPIANGTGDEHTFLEIPVALLEEKDGEARALFPLPVKIIGKRLYVAQSHQHAQAGDEITRINELPTAEIIRQLADLFAGTGERQKYFFVAQSFGAALYVRYGFETRFLVTLADAETSLTRDVNIEAPTRAMPQVGPDSIILNRSALDRASVTTSSKLGDGPYVLNFAAFEDPDQTLASVVDDVFAGLKTNPKAGLVVDMRRNQGGDTRIASLILSRLCVGNYKWFDHAEMKVSPELKDQLMSFVPPAIRWAQIQYIHPLTSPIWQTSEGSVATVNFDAEAARPLGECYDGKVAVLMGAANYSAAASFLDAVRTYEGATLIGEPSGGFANHYGNTLVGRLPNSRLRVIVPSSYNVGYLTGSIQPDVTAPETAEGLRIGRDPAMEAATTLLRQE